MKRSTSHRNMENIILTVERDTGTIKFGASLPLRLDSFSMHRIITLHILFILYFIHILLLTIICTQKCTKVYKGTYTCSLKTRTHKLMPERGSCLREAIKCVVDRSHLSLLIVPLQSDQKHTLTQICSADSSNSTDQNLVQTHTQTPLHSHSCRVLHVHTHTHCTRYTQVHKSLPALLVLLGILRVVMMLCVSAHACMLV